MPEITETNIGDAWTSAVRLASSLSKNEVANLLVNIHTHSDCDFLGSRSLRDGLDRSLLENGKFCTSTVANTIFPSSLWTDGMTRDSFYQRYLKLWPRIVAHKQNRRGTYFQRMIGYPRASDPSFNQLEHVISAYKSGTRRRSTLQCSILVPNLDLNATPYQGFPCMQQVAFMPDGKGGLTVCALYPMQYLWERAYGNYWGLVRLGYFMAGEMGLIMRGITCVSFIAKLDQPAIAKTVMEEHNAV